MVKKCLQDFVNGMEINGMKKPNGFQYLCCQDFVLQNGTEFSSPEPFPNLMEPKQCFCNAATLMLINEQRYVYCEGYATSIIPVDHAWVLDTWTDEIVDPTWAEPGIEYFGIAFNTQYVRRRLCKNEVYGLIDTYWDNFELLRDTTTEWKYEATVNA